MRPFPTISTPRCPSSTPAACRAAPTARRRSPGTSDRSMSAAPVGAWAGLVAALRLAVRGDDPLHELVADDVLAAEANEVDVLDLVEDVSDLHEPGLRAALEVD